MIKNGLHALAFSVGINCMVRLIFPELGQGDRVIITNMWMLAAFALFTYQDHKDDNATKR